MVGGIRTNICATIPVRVVLRGLTFPLRDTRGCLSNHHHKHRCTHICYEALTKYSGRGRPRKRKVDIYRQFGAIIGNYRPDYSKKHKINSSTFLKEFSKLLDEITSLPGILVITGDFNIHMESLDNKYTLELAEMFEQYSLNRLVTKPTHKNGGLIDLVITSNNSSVQDISIHEDGVGSDHHPIRFKGSVSII